MGEWKQLVLTLLGSGAVFTFLGIVATLYFTRGRTNAEAGKLKSEAHKTDADAARTEAESMQLYVAEIRNSLGSWKSAMSDWAECVKEKSAAETRAASAETRLREESAERERLNAVAESYRMQIEKLQERETDLVGQLREARAK